MVGASLTLKIGTIINLLSDFVNDYIVKSLNNTLSDECRINLGITVSRMVRVIMVDLSNCNSITTVIKTFGSSGVLTGFISLSRLSYGFRDQMVVRES